MIFSEGDCMQEFQKNLTISSSRIFLPSFLMWEKKSQGFDLTSSMGQFRAAI